MVGFETNISNLFNQHSTTLIQQNLVRTGSIFPSTAAKAGDIDYLQLINGTYNYITSLNTTDPYSGGTARIFSNLYGLPYGWQDPRSMRFKISFTF